MRINHNLPALNTYRQLSMNEANGHKSTEKLSSGLRINRAGDDAAGLAISEKMRAQIRGTDQASRNSQDAISMIQTAEGALNEGHDILQRMRELAVQASTDTNTSADRGEIQKEVTQLTAEINRIGSTTEFNTQKLLNGDKSNTQISVTAGLLTSTSGIQATTTSLGGVVSVASGTTNGDYKFLVSSTAFTGLNATKVALSGTATAAITAVTYTGTANTVSFAGDILSFSGAASGSIFNGSTPTTSSGTVTLLKTASGFQVTVAGFSGVTPTGGTVTPSGVLFVSQVVADGSGKYTYNANGLSFVITDSGSIATGNTIAYSFASGSVTAVSGTVGTKSVLWSSVGTIGANTTTNLGASNFKVSSGADIGDYSVVITNAGGTASGSTSGTIQLKFSGIDGTVRILDAWSGITFTSGLGPDFKLVSHGITLDLSGLGTLLAGTSTLSFAVQGTTYSGSVLNASGTQIGTGLIGVDGGLGLKASYSQTFNGLTISYASGQTGIVSGTSTISVRGLESLTAKSGDSSVAFQIGANQSQALSLEISDMRANALGITRSSAEGSTTGFASTLNVNNGTSSTATEYALDLTTSVSAANAITVIQSAIDKVSSERSKLGSYQNRLEHTINNLGTSSENLTASESRIRDVDMAKEIMNNTKNNILAQAAQAMLAQANQAPQSVLQLLR